MKVRGLIPQPRLSEDAQRALARGDVDELLRIKRAEFGGFVMMADSDDDDDDHDDNDDDRDSDTDDDDDDKSKDKSKKDKDEDDSDDEDDRLERMRKRMKAADRRREEAERKLREKENEEKSDLERAQGELEEVTKERDALKGTISTLRLQNAFLTANNHSWHDPDDALDVADRKGYLEDVVDEDGEVDKKALSKALDRLAKDKPYLVNDGKGKKDDDDKEEDVPSGESGGRRSDNLKDTKAKKAQMKNRFPVLNR